MDYTPFLFSYNERPETNNKPKRARAKNNVGSIILIIIIIACLITALVLAGNFSGERLFESVVAAINRQTSITYYMVSRSGVAGEESAKVQSTMVRAGGGSGYIYHQNNQYYVSMATYLDKSSAEAVVAKNKDTVIIEFTLSLNEVYDLSIDNDFLKEVIKYMQDALMVLDDAIIKYAKSEMQTGEVLSKLEAERNKLFDLKSRLIDAACEGRDALINTIDPMFGGLEAIVSAGSPNGLLSSMRYVHTAGVVSLCSLGNLDD